MKTINGQQLKQQLDAGHALVVVEALPKAYYQKGHIPGAASLPLDELNQRAAALIPELDAQVVVYCASATCENSHFAAKRLTDLGYQNVAVYPGGKADWQELGYPLEQSV